MIGNLEPIFDQLEKFFDRIFGNDVLGAGLSAVSATRLRTTFYVFFGGAMFLLFRFLGIMVPQVVPGYGHLMTVIYYDGPSSNFFVSVATVSGAFWAIFVAILSFFKDQVGVEAEAQSVSRWINMVNVVDARAKNHWIILQIVVITSCFQSAMLFSLISLVPWATNWMISGVSAAEIPLIASLLGFAMQYQSRTQAARAALEEIIFVRVKRLEAGVDRVAQRVGILTLDVSSFGDTRWVSQRIEWVEGILPRLRSRVQNVADRIAEMEKHERLLSAALSARSLRTLTTFLMIVLAGFAAYPQYQVASVLVLLLMLIGLTISIRCVFVMMTFSTDAKSGVLL